MPVSDAGLSNRRQWLILAGLALGVCVTNAFARFAYGLLLPSMKAELGWSYAQAGWLNTANALGYLAGAVLTMALIARISPSRLFSFGLITTTVALLATGLHAGLWWQTFWRIAAGVFGAMSFSTAGALAAQLFQHDPRRNALAIALLFGFGGGIGIVLAGAALPVMLDRMDEGAWVYGWIAVGATSVVFGPLALWASETLRPPKREPGPRPGLPVRRMLAEMAGYAAFGMGYFVYFTFLSAWMTERGFSAVLIALVWVMLGLCLCLSPFVWRPIFAQHRSGLPLALVLAGVALGSALPVLAPNGPGLVLSATVFGLSVFMSPGAATSFVRHNLPIEAWGAAISLFTVVFATAQIAGPYAAGLIGDATGDIGNSLIVAAAILLGGAALAALQRPLQD